jgi:hypothetical protein
VSSFVRRVSEVGMVLGVLAALFVGTLCGGSLMGGLEIRCAARFRPYGAQRD